MLPAVSRPSLFVRLAESPAARGPGRWWPSASRRLQGIWLAEPPIITADGPLLATLVWGRHPGARVEGDGDTSADPNHNHLTWLQASGKRQTVLCKDIEYKKSKVTQFFCSISKCLFEHDLWNTVLQKENKLWANKILMVTTESLHYFLFNVLSFKIMINYLWTAFHVVFKPVK